MKFSSIAVLALVYNISALRVYESDLAELEDENNYLAQVDSFALA